MKRFSRRPSPAMAVAFIALLAALSGTAVALPGKNTVDSGDIKKGAVKASDIGRNAVTRPKIRNGAVNSQKVGDDSLTGADINESTLGQVPSANTATTATNATNAANADTLDGRNSTDFLPSTGNAPSGTLLTGVLNVAAGLLKPAAGSVKIFGQPLTGNPVATARTSGSPGCTSTWAPTSCSRRPCCACSASPAR